MVYWKEAMVQWPLKIAEIDWASREGCSNTALIRIWGEHRLKIFLEKSWVLKSVISLSLWYSLTRK